MKSAFLIAKIDDDAGRVAGMHIAGISTSREPPWEMTRHSRDEYVVLLEAKGPSFGEALATLRRSYPDYMPRLAAKFPFPE